MATARKVLSNTVWQLAAKLAQAVLGFVVIKITTTYLSQSGSLSAYGSYLAVYEYLAYFGIIADLGLYTIAVKEMSKDDDNIPKIIGNVITLRLILVSLTTILSIALIFLIPRYNYPGSLIPYGVVIASGTVFLTILNGTLTSVLQTKYRMDKASIGVIIGKILTVALMVYIVFFGYPRDITTGFYMLMWAGVAGTVLMLIYTAHHVRKFTPIRPRFDLDLWQTVLKQSLPYGIALILSTIYFRVDSIIILFFKGEEELAIYGPAMKMLEQFSIIPLYFMNSILPILTKAIHEGTGRHKAIIKNSFDVLAAAAFPVTVGGFILAYPLIFIIASPDFLSRLSEGFYGTDIALQILIFALLFQFLNVLFAFVLIALDKQKKLLYINAFCVLFNLITNLIFIPKFGFRAAALTSVLSELFILIGNYYYAKKYLDFDISFTNLGKIILSALIMGFAVHLLQPITYTWFQNWNVLPLTVIGALVYLIMTFATGTLSKEKIRLIMKK